MSWLSALPSPLTPPSPTLPDGCPISSHSRAAYFRQRYANLWLFARLRGCYEPAAILFICVWLNYKFLRGDTTARRHMTETVVLGTILGISFLFTLFLLLMGLAVGGRWREMPQSLSWSVVQKLEMVSATARAQRHMKYGSTTWPSKVSPRACNANLQKRTVYVR